MAGTSDIIAHGIGSWGSVNKIPTLGLNSGTSVFFFQPADNVHFKRAPLSSEALLNKAPLTADDLRIATEKVPPKI